MHSLHSRRDFLGGTVATASMGLCGTAVAKSFPARPVTMIVPYPAGGPSDAVGRVVADGLRSSLDQPVIVENIGGASGSLGIGRAAKAEPDGYTICLGLWSTHVVNGAALVLPYDVANDFEPIELIASNPLMIIGRGSLPADDLNGFLAWLRANPNKATAGTGGNGGASRLAGIFLQKRTGTSFQFVAYRGLGPAMQDLSQGTSIS